jgi:tyrosyl-tRNA synthetase
MLKDNKIWIVKLMTFAGLCQTSSEARRLISQGAVSINNEDITDSNAEISIDEPFVIKVGKRRFARISR